MDGVRARLCLAVELCRNRTACLVMQIGENMQGGSNRLLTPAEVADWLKVSEVTVKNRYRKWGLKAQKVGRLLRFRERDIVAYLDSRYE
ncbi:helix-turn-helix domain-containing protein [Streptomyces sp. NBC_01613]|uniref:helix-turn-helix domain-containing protein n=2 Tax=Streptomyces sp. NBC_01613 TaxID=2975896 RepID=UPI00386B7658